MKNTVKKSILLFVFLFFLHPQISSAAQKQLEKTKGLVVSSTSHKKSTSTNKSKTIKTETIPPPNVSIKVDNSEFLRLYLKQIQQKIKKTKEKNTASNVPNTKHKKSATLNLKKEPKAHKIKSVSQSVMLVKVNNGKSLHITLKQILPTKSSASYIQYSILDKRLFVLEKDSLMYSININDTKRKIKKFPVPEGAKILLLDPTNRFIAVGSAWEEKQAAAHIYDARTARLIQRLFGKNPSGMTRSMQFNAQGSELTLSGYDDCNTAATYNIKTGRIVSIFEQPLSSITISCITKILYANDRIIMGRSNGAPEIWRRNGQLIAMPVYQLGSLVSDIAVSDNKVISTRQWAPYYKQTYPGIDIRQLSSLKLLISPKYRNAKTDAKKILVLNKNYFLTVRNTNDGMDLWNIQGQYQRFISFPDMKNAFLSEDKKILFIIFGKNISIYKISIK